MTPEETRLRMIDAVMAIADDKQAELIASTPDWRDQFKSFVQDFYATSSPDDMIAGDPATLHAIAFDMFKASEKRVDGGSVVRIINPRKRRDGWATDHTVLQIVNRDMPFLVDSITGALSTELRFRIHMMHHPMMPVRRDAAGVRTTDPSVTEVKESYLYVEIDAQSDKDVLREIKEKVQGVLRDVNQVVLDFKGMLAKIDETVASLTVNPPPIEEDRVQEVIRFLRWMGDNHFTFLGFREYRFSLDQEELSYSIVDESSLGILRDPSRNVLRNKDGLTPMSAEIQHFLESPDPLYITKANVRSTVHRTTHMDYIGVKVFDADGKAVGERRFVGLFTSLSYSEFARDVPVLRRKVEAVKARAPFPPGSYGGKTLNHILEAFPRDELFQVSENWLFDTLMGVVQLMERPRTAAFIRQDKFERFVSALVYVPRETYHSALRIAISEILCTAFKGEVSVYHAQLSDNVLARWHFIIRTKPGNVPNVSLDAINEAIADAAQGWDDRLLKELVGRHGEEVGNRLNHVYRLAFTTSYREAFSPAQAAYDIETLEQVAGENQLSVDFYRHLADDANCYRMKIYHGQHRLPLSDCLPILEDMGFRVLQEHSYALAGSKRAYIHDFLLEWQGASVLDMEQLKPLVTVAFAKVWEGEAEQDGFNELVVAAGLAWNEVILLRAYGKYLRQLGLGFTPEYIADCIVKHASIARDLVKLFSTQFDPSQDCSAIERNALAKAAQQDLFERLEAVASLDEDRILRAYINVIRATQRTNFYQDHVLDGDSGRALAFKIRSQDVEEAPLPRPYAEMWVYSPRVEGVHLRSGPIARGGLRWSDRREDFRTEVLGLVKAQQVKNAVIVPQGAKGGFYPKQLPVGGDREAFMKEGVAAYRCFISSLLSVTDNLVGGKLVPPPQVTRRDGDDPYLVVAADKGTATFSDIANGISDDAGFWLSDAFASGGSNGYDHKKMGITARGAWVSVQRHMRELGTNVQEEPFTVIGIGDMAGDVFGNGMLLSKTIQLRAAFNHMHIFIDPNPEDTEAHWAERKRLFELPRSTWDDYNRDLLSKGGGVFSRAEKSIELSEEMQSWLGVTDKKMSPAALINAILKAEADLLWFGGIGTYVRAADETHAEVGDRANDMIRVTAEELRVKVVGEGGNLGMTQRGRIDFARRGGMVNTDFIDNSAGVDCSDKEVNIKILLADAIQRGDLPQDERNDLLEAMTDQVAEIVLADNYLQTQAISLAKAGAIEGRENHLGLIRTLERDANLDRVLEVLPSDEGFAEMASEDQGLCGPEFATLLAYTKISLTEVLMRGTFIDQPVLRRELEWGFPTQLRERFPHLISDHRLKRELVATVLANDVVNRGGLTYVMEIKEETGLAVEDIVAAFVCVREIYGLADIWAEIEDLDYKVPAAVQYDMLSSISASMKGQSLWMLRNLKQPFDVAALVDRFKDNIRALFDVDLDVLSAPAQDAFVSRRDTLAMSGVPHRLATFVSAFEVLTEGNDVISVSEETDMRVEEVARVHFALGDMLGFDWLRRRAERINMADHWTKLSVGATLEDLADQQRALVRAVCQDGAGKDADAIIADYRESAQTEIIRAARLVDDLTASGNFNVPKLSFAARHLRSILR